MIAGYLMGGETTEKKKGENPLCTELGDYLADDIYKAIAYKESTWAQFNDKGEPNGGPTADYGIMQINIWWENASWPGTQGTPNPVSIDWDKVLWDWKYNVDLGKAIYNDNLNLATADLKKAGITEPTDEQLRLSLLSRYNCFTCGPYYGSDGKRQDHKGANYADSVNGFYKDKTWEKEALNCVEPKK